MTISRFDATVEPAYALDCAACRETWGRFFNRRDAVTARREHNATPEHRYNRKLANKERRVALARSIR